MNAPSVDSLAMGDATRLDLSLDPGADTDLLCKLVHTNRQIKFPRPTLLVGERKLTAELGAGGCRNMFALYLPSGLAGP